PRSPATGESDPLVSRKEKHRRFQKRNPPFHHQSGRRQSEPLTACRNRPRPLVGGKQKPLEERRNPVARRPGSAAQSQRSQEPRASAQRHPRAHPARRTCLAQPSLPPL